MISKHKEPKEAYVWAWLPGSTTPVVAGLIEQVTGSADRRTAQYEFTYARSYCERPDSLPLYLPELPLQCDTPIPAPNGLAMASCLRDGSPDAWGRRVIINRVVGAATARADADDLDELTFLLESGSDRIGALDFQASPREYMPREGSNASLDELQRAAEHIEKGLPLTPALLKALRHGSSVGGARPKALVEHGDRKHIAKFSAINDTYSVVKAEFIAMRLAHLAGLRVAPVTLTRSDHRDVLLIERFDRAHNGAGWTRRAMVSALTILGLDEMMARYASYADLAEIIRHRFTEPTATLRELFGRMVFNILCGNTDDHARNHAALWDGDMLTLTPAYDICPQARSGGEATQAMLIEGQRNHSQLTLCLQAAHHFLLNQEEARNLINQQIETIRSQWLVVCEEAELTPIDRDYLWGRQFLHPYALEAWED